MIVGAATAFAGLQRHFQAMRADPSRAAWLLGMVLRILHMDVSAFPTLSAAKWPERGPGAAASADAEQTAGSVEYESCITEEAIVERLVDFLSDAASLIRAECRWVTCTLHLPRALCTSGPVVTFPLSA